MNYSVVMTTVSIFLNIFLSSLYLLFKMCDGLGGGLCSLSALLVADVTHFLSDMMWSNNSFRRVSNSRQDKKKLLKKISRSCKEKELRLFEKVTRWRFLSNWCFTSPHSESLFQCLSKSYKETYASALFYLMIFISSVSCISCGEEQAAFGYQQASNMNVYYLTIKSCFWLLQIQTWQGVDLPCHVMMFLSLS